MFSKFKNSKFKQNIGLDLKNWVSDLDQNKQNIQLKKEKNKSHIQNF